MGDQERRRKNGGKENRTRVLIHSSLLLLFGLQVQGGSDKMAEPGQQQQQQVGGGAMDNAQQGTSSGTSATPNAPTLSTVEGTEAPDTRVASTPTSQQAAQHQSQQQPKQRPFVQAANLVKQSRQLPGSVPGARVPPKDIHNMTDAVGTAATSTAAHTGTASTGGRFAADGAPASSSLNAMVRALRSACFETDCGMTSKKHALGSKSPVGLLSLHAL